MKQRIISAIVVLGIFIPLLILNNNLYKIGVVVIGLLGLKEIIEIREIKKKFPFLVKLISYMLMIFFICNNIGADRLNLYFDYKYISAALIPLLLPCIFYHDSDHYNVEDAFYLIGSVMFLGLAFNLLIVIRNYDITYIIYLFLITIITDTYAYISGKLSGRNKLAPNISPKKTIEGFIVGSVVGTFVSSSFYYIYIDDAINLMLLISITLFLSIAGQLGDLVFSSIKRKYNKKDFSNIMPGHGGVLDRLDSIIFVIITFLFFISLI